VSVDFVYVKICENECHEDVYSGEYTYEIGKYILSNIEDVCTVKVAKTGKIEEIYERIKKIMKRKHGVLLYDPVVEIKCGNKKFVIAAFSA